MRSTLLKITIMRVIGYSSKKRDKLNVNYLHKYILLCLFVFSLPMLSYAQEEYIKATEQKAKLNFNKEKLYIELIIASLNEDKSKNDIIVLEIRKAQQELQKFSEIYPDRYFSEIGPEKIIRVQQIEADFRTKHRNEIYKWEKIKNLEKKFYDIISQESKISSAFQRKLDIIPSLINATKSDGDFWRAERSSVENIIKIMHQATSSGSYTNNFKSSNSTTLKEYQDMIRSLDTAFDNFIGISSKYPLLQNDYNFKNLKSQYVDNKTNIVAEQKKYNEMIRAYKVLTEELNPEYNIRIKPLFSMD